MSNIVIKSENTGAVAEILGVKLYVDNNSNSCPRLD
jgi:hypothetical protein